MSVTTEKERKHAEEILASLWELDDLTYGQKVLMMRVVDELARYRAEMQSIRLS